jgi:murein L,D-transpeptidase YafK
MFFLRLFLVLLTLGDGSGALQAAVLEKLHLEVYKARRELQLFDGPHLLKIYPIALGTNPISPKERQGDRATPEGAYIICQKNPQSQFHLSLGISYPGPHDAERGFKAGLISAVEKKAILKAAAQGKTPPWNTPLGGEVFVHGRGSKPDWTWGCVALDDKDIEELYRIIPVGTPIIIKP